MNILLWILQIFLAFHTAVGAIWKFSNSEQSIPSLRAISHGLWQALSIFEILCSVCLIIPAFYKRWSILAPLAALGIATEMFVFSGFHVYSGETDNGPLIYWLIVAAICVFIAWGRLRKRG